MGNRIEDINLFRFLNDSALMHYEIFMLDQNFLKFMQKVLMFFQEE